MKRSKEVADMALWHVSETGKASIGGLPAPTSSYDFQRELLRTLDDIRLASISRDALVTPSDIERMLKGRSSVIRAWIKQHLYPVEHPTGRRMYVAGDVLDALDAVGVRR
jgi:hypothetical protein